MARESISEETSTPPTTPVHATEVLNQCGSSQESEGPDSPAAPSQVKVKIETVKAEVDETEEEEEEEDPLKQEENIKNEDIKKEDSKVVTFKDETKEEPVKEEKDDMNEEKSNAIGAASATKRKLSISEYRQRRGGGTGGSSTASKQDRPSSPHNSAASSPLSSSEDEDEREPPGQAIVNKSIMLEHALDSSLTKKLVIHNTDRATPSLV